MKRRSRNQDDYELINDVIDEAKTETAITKINWTALFQITSQRQLPLLISALLCSCAAGFIQPAMAILFGRFFNTFSDYSSGTVDGDTLMESALTDIYGLICVGGAAWMLRGTSFGLWLIHGEIRAEIVRNRLFQALLQKDLSWYEMQTNGVGAFVARLSTQVRQFQLGASQPIGLVCTSITQALVSMGVAFYHNWKVTLVVLGATPVVVVVVVFARRNMSTALNDQSAALHYSIRIVELARYQHWISTAARNYLRQARINACEIGILQLSSTLVILTGVYLGVVLVHQDSSTVQQVLTAFWSCLSTVTALEEILPHLIVLEKGSEAAVTLERITSEAPNSGSQQSHDGIIPDSLDGDIEFREVSFSYPSRSSHLALDTATLFFPAGETTFLVGKSGSGKSTLGALILRFYEPQSGTITIDGRNIGSLNTNWIRNNVTLVQQQSSLFNETLHRNIAFGCRNFHQMNLDVIQDCLMFAKMSDDVDQLPAGIHTMVGEGGTAISGGQKQRVALARARLRDTPILILDESTSALDVNIRNTILHNIREWRSGKTTIIITHDMDQILDKDFTYVLHDGHISAQGYRSKLSAEFLRFGLEQRIVRRENSGDHPSSVNRRKDAFLSFPSCGRSQVPRTQSRYSTSHMASTLNSNIIQNKYSLLSRHAGTRIGITGTKQVSSREWTKMSNITINGLTYCSSRMSTEHNPSINQAHQHTHLSITQSIRPVSTQSMSLHQAVVMKKLYDDSIGRRSVQSVKLVHTPAFLKRMTITSKVLERPVEASEAQSHTQLLTLREIFVTVLPSISLSKRFYLISGFISATVHSSIPPLLSFLLTELFITFGDNTGWQNKAKILALKMLGIAFGDGASSYLMHYQLEVAGQQWIDHLRGQAMERVLQQPKAWFDNENHNIAQFCATLDYCAEETRNLLGRFAAQVYVVVLMMTLATLWSFTQCWELTLLGVASFLVMYVVTSGFNRTSSIWETRTSKEADKINSIFMETFTDICTVRAFTLESYFHEKCTNATRRAFKVGISRGLYNGLFFGLSDGMVSFVTAAILGYGAILVKSETYAVEPVLTVLAMLLFSTANANAIVAFIPQISSSVEGASRLLRLSQIIVNSHETLGKLKLDKNNPDVLSGPIKFINQSFQYPSRPDAEVLSNVTLTIPPNQCTAIVGASGSGKSTLTSLALGFYPPLATPSPQTTLSLSGHDIRTLHLCTLRSLVALAPQTAILLPGTIRENIFYGDLPPSLQTEFNLHTAAKQAGIHDFILTLPDGYNTIIGSEGQGLSGGQAQRISIARALARRPRILILDEPTSALDWESADIVRRNIKQLSRRSQQNRPGQYGMTVIVVTHDKETMEWADRVVVMKRGFVAEEGSYRELLAQRGELWMLLNGTDGNGEGSSQH